MLDDLRDLLKLAFDVRREVFEARTRAAGNNLAWASYNRVLKSIDGTVDALLEVYTLLATEQENATPNPEEAS